MSSREMDDFHTSVTLLQRFVCAFEEGRLMRPSLSSSLPDISRPSETIAFNGLLFDLALRLERRGELTVLSRNHGLAAAIEMLARRRLREQNGRIGPAEAIHSTLIKHIAIDSGCSIDTLRRRIAKTTGTSPREWRQRQRIGRAIELIQEGMKVESAALECGYRSQRAFFAAFKKLTDMTPSTVRNMSRAETESLMKRLLPWVSEGAERCY